MIDEHRHSKDATPAKEGTPAAHDAAGRDLAMSGSSAATVTGEIHDSVDPYDYAETIVRDLALHVGTRLRDFRDDLAAMHAAVVQLPETMRINAMGHSIQELRERVAHLTGVVSLQTTRPAEEAERLGRGMNDLAQRVAGLEAWIAAAKRAGVRDGELPAIPLPDGGLVGMEQFDRVIDQMHESFVKLVAAVREVQLDLRDLRTDVRDRVAAVAALPKPEPRPEPQAPTIDPAALDRLTARVAELDGRLRDLAAAPPAPVPVSAPVTLATPAGTADLAALAFGAWYRLSQPTGAEALQAAVAEMLGQLGTALPEVVRQPQVTKGSGLVAVAAGRMRGQPVVALLATEDLCGHSWTLSDGGTEMTAMDPPGLVRTPCWRALLATAVLIEQARPEAVVLPLLVYGNGWLDRAPGRDEMLAHGQAIGAGRAASRMIAVSAGGLSLHGLLHPGDIIGALVQAV